MSFITTLLNRGRLAAETGRANSLPEDSYLWDTFDEALNVAEERQELLEDLGEEGLRQLLSVVQSNAPLQARLELIAGASSWDELTADAVADAAALDADTLERRKRKQDLIDMALRLGEGGLKLLLRVALV